MSDDLSLWAAGNGTSFLLTSIPDGSGLMLCPGSTGLGMIPRNVRTREGSGDGGEVLGMRASMRTLLLKIGYVGDVAGQRSALDSLRSVLLADDARLIAQRGVESDQWVLHVTYEGGLEGDMTLSVQNPRFWTASVSLTAAQPYWEAASSDVMDLRVDAASTPFVDSLWMLPVGASTGIGDSLVVNDSDARSPVSWLLRGPCDDASVSVGGRGFSIPAGLADGESILVDPTVSGMPAVTVKGVNAYSRLATGPRFPKLAPGANTVRMSMTGATAGTRVESDTVLARNLVSNPGLRTDMTGWTVDESTVWQHTAGSPGRLDCTADDVSLHAAWYTARKPDDGWPGTTFAASLGGVDPGAAQHVELVDASLMVEQVGADGTLLSSTFVDATVMGRAAGMMQLMDGCVSIRVGAYGQQPQGVGFALLSFGDSDPGYFDGTAQYGEWLGTVDASMSELHASELQGGSLIRMTWNRRREIIR